MTNAEINKAIAERVMGWKTKKDYVGLLNYKLNESGSKGIWVGNWNPTNRIDHAWMVVEKIKELGWWLSLDHYPHDNKWHCEFFNSFKMRRAEADTAQMAICLAALEAVPPTNSQQQRSYHDTKQHG